jgi:hypothetical protein
MKTSLKQWCGCRILSDNEDSNLIPVHQHVLDVAGGAMEYDVLRDARDVGHVGANAVHARQAEGPVDARCPQTSEFSLVRCIAHQHPGVFPLCFPVRACF